MNKIKQGIKKFTLMELLIVIAMISILLSLLLPSMGKAREASKIAVCMSNQKQIYTGLQAYMVENNGRLPVLDDDNAAKNTWPIAVDEYISGEKHSRVHRHQQTKSPIWSSCPGRVEHQGGLGESIKVEDVDYGIFIKNNYRMVIGTLHKVEEPASSGILADADQEAGRTDIGNSWFIAAYASHRVDVYNYITGKTNGVVRHMFNTKMNTATLDGAVHNKKWMTLSEYSTEFSQWLSDF